MTEDDFTIKLTRDQALVLSDWLDRMIGTAEFDGLVAQDRAVWSPIYKVSGTLETSLVEVANRDPVVAYAGEPLRLVVNRMAETGFTRMPVLEEGSRKLAGMVSLDDLLHARTRTMREEQHRERVLHIRLPFARQTSN